MLILASKYKKILAKLILILVPLILYSCSETYTPKPRVYFRISFPERGYRLYDEECNFSFSYPTYAEVVNDNSRNAEPCWLNLSYKPFMATLHISYKELCDTSNLIALLEDSRSLVYKHTIKAEEITENVIVTNSGIYGMLYELEGNTASAIQFYLTDSTNHYLRGALYFNTKTNRDSLQPVIDFLKIDIEQFINTMKWKQEI